MRALAPGISNGSSVGNHVLTPAIVFALSKAALVLVLPAAAATIGIRAMSASISTVAPSPEAWNSLAQAASAVSALPNSLFNCFARSSLRSSVHATQTEPTESFLNELAA